MTICDVMASGVKKFKEAVMNLRGSRKVILMTVFIAIFLDNMLLTVVVPIVPNLILRLEKQKHGIHNAPNVTEVRIICKNRTSSTDIYPRQIGRLFPKQYENRRAQNGTYWFGPKYDVNIPKECEPQKIVNKTAEKIIKVLRKKTEIKEYGDANVKAGLMFGSKALVQMIINPFMGSITNRIGYTIPMFTGFIIMIASTVIFAFGETYLVLFIARAFQGIGSACSSVAGMGMLARSYPDDVERGRAMSIALGGLALGVLIGPPFGGVMYQFTGGKKAPFLILAGMALIDGALQMFVLQPGVQPESQQGTSYLKLLKDPYILIAAGSITFANMGIAMMEPSLPIWMKKIMGAAEWQQGLAFLPASISYLLGTNTFGPFATRIGRWLSTLIGMVVISVCLFVVPFCKSVILLIAPMFGLGFAIGMVDSSMMPHMAYLVDLRHVAVYGKVYAIADISFSIGFAVGPMLSGSIVKAVGFQWMLWIMAIACLMYAPSIAILRSPPGGEEKESLISDE